ncbi:MAG: GGDEF domain-containing protein [Oscillospiraceae bacterium]|jgi:diguanylate cyclase (GGDEF)-like protein|nr:GGDEF domain-containing protein [Oscillospiraceae bacterium]
MNGLLKRYKLQYEDIVDFSDWSRRAFVCIWLSLAFVILGEIVILTIDHINGIEPDYLHGLLTYVIIALPFQVIVAAFVIWITGRFIRGNSPFFQSIAMVTGISFICFSTVYLHCRDGLIYVAFAFPILMSLLYIDKKSLLYATFLNLVFYLVFVLFLLPTRPDAAPHGYMEILTVINFIILLYIAGRMNLLALSMLVQGIIEKNEQIKRDAFTGLFNHTVFYEHLEEIVGKTQAEGGGTFTLLLADIDDFKNINDSHGHDVGDRVILCYARSLKTVVGERGDVFRYGGDEFAALLRVGGEAASALAADITRMFEEEVKALWLAVPVTVSTGLCEYNQSQFHGARDIFSAADFALYRAKQSGGAKGNTHLWRPGLDLVSQLQAFNPGVE